MQDALGFMGCSLNGPFYRRACIRGYAVVKLTQTICVAQTLMGTCQLLHTDWPTGTRLHFSKLKHCLLRMACATLCVQDSNNPARYSGYVTAHTMQHTDYTKTHALLNKKTHLKHIFTFQITVFPFCVCVLHDHYFLIQDAAGRRTWMLLCTGCPWRYINIYTLNTSIQMHMKQ